MYFTLDLVIKGSYYYQAQSLFERKELHEGKPLLPVREADNPHDQNAVQLLYAQDKPLAPALIGYLPRQIAAVLRSKRDLQSIRSIRLLRIHHQENRLQLICRVKLNQPWNRALQLLLLAAWLQFSKNLSPDRR
ncbi:HIRAN domain-containing protein [Thiomicrorhabdus sp.]|uniref:HIRAN domain-containing protein n=1 Tax=Thiomicrorhabdus sp. TaxID=2039724 RepID=UPI0029C93657|nr:HIRAN domain-containing protein [Thiomicrorhabdus sp.]